jgi:branched-chain amino acid transport system ATP-binding protein
MPTSDAADTSPPGARHTGTLSLVDVSGGYAMGDVLRSVSVHVEPGEIVSVLGRNGAGKTTLARCVMGVVRATTGAVRVGSTDLTPLPPHRRARLGVRWVPQDESVFPGLTVREHLMVADPGERSFDAAFELFPALSGKLSQEAATLSGGERRLLGMAQAVLGKPAFLLLDEPSEGVAPLFVDVLGDAIQKLGASGCGVLLMENNLDLALAVSSRAYVIERGAIAGEVDPQEARRDASLLEKVGL